MTDPSIDHLAAQLEQARALMRARHYLPEPDALAPLIGAASVGAAERSRILSTARGLLTGLRAAQDDGWVNQFLAEYRLGTKEGIALLSLAEAFLRVPDPETADLLIADKLTDADWRAHGGKSASTLVNSATWGLVLGKAVLNDADDGSILKRLLSRAGEPFVRQAVGAAMRLMGQVFVMGRNIDEAMDRMAHKDHKGFTASFDMLGEAARTYGDADRYFDSYIAAIDAVGARKKTRPECGHSISVKLSALHPRYEAAQSDLCIPALIERVGLLAERAAAHGLALTIDAEESARLILSLDVIRGVAERRSLSGWDGLGMAVQAYSKRAGAVIDWADTLATATGRRMAVRLVKGAYWDTEIKLAQEKCLPDYPLYTRKSATDVSYLACAKAMLAAPHIYPAFATHNAMTVATILEWAGGRKAYGRRDFEFQRLHGMGDGLFEQLVQSDGYHCRIYAPVGGHKDLLAYLVRRLLENGANSSFVHQMADENVDEAELLADPVDKVRASGGQRNSAIPLPIDLFQPERVNSHGLDLDDRWILSEVAEVVARPVAVEVTATAKVGAMIGAAHAAFPDWAARGVDARADVLNRLADLLEENRGRLMAIAVQEAKKTIADALAEVREAVDFCRYYAARARTDLASVALPGPTGEANRLHYAPRGVWACIAPWNFPLAIFLGQVAAALVTGNAVVAKPAPQTPRIAAFAVQLAHRAGVPKDVLHLAIGGAEIGAALTADPRIMGVAFTGSVPTARAIARGLLVDDNRPLVPLLAETGGINAMLVDSTALPEQVVRDVVISGFQSAGQRCSALRLLCVQEEVVGSMTEMLVGAMQALRLGDPADPATDVGPVIDQAAYDRLMAYRADRADDIIHTLDAPQTGLFVPPTLIGLDTIEELTAEWFGPIVHLTTFKAGALEDTVRRINAKGFGLTMGLHSRVARAAGLVEAHARVGNLYINRSMIGAIVGSQPFGGEGHSGTGPKAGGPNYLHRFVTERVTSTDTTSAGGNASLLSLGE
jgi:RHH-type transcriptional regulator, proline utilization regulon repressor / proline dehydrogenase / delta 1-pyrroline-5-carboxylate dehydrogenase